MQITRPFLDYTYTLVDTTVNSSEGHYGKYSFIETASTSPFNFNTLYASGNEARHTASTTLAASRGSYNVSWNMASGTIASSAGVYGQASNGYFGRSAVGTTTTAYGVWGVTNNNAAGYINTGMGVWGNVSNQGSGIINEARGVAALVSNTSTGSINTAYTLLARTAANSGGGQVLNNYGLYIQDQSAVGSNNSFNFFSAGVTAKNYFQGTVNIGATSTASQVYIQATSSLQTLPVLTVASTSGDSYLTVSTLGNVGIGTSTPWQTLSVTGTVGFDGLTAGAGAGSLCLSANKEVTYSAGATCTVSSGRFKYDIFTASTGLEFVNKLRPVTFKYNADIGVPGEQFGFIAEEVEALDPRLVVHDAEGLPFSVRYENLTAVLAKAIQELSAKVEGILHIVGIVTETLTAKKVDTKELCVDGVCVSKEEWNALLQSRNITALSPEVPLPEPIVDPSVASSTEPVASTTEIQTEESVPAQESPTLSEVPGEKPAE